MTVHTRISLNALITRALIDKDIQNSLMGSKRGKVLRTFDLPKEAEEIVMEIEAPVFYDFVNSINTILTSEK